MENRFCFNLNNKIGHSEDIRSEVQMLQETYSRKCTGVIKFAQLVLVNSSMIERSKIWTDVSAQHEKMKQV